MSDSNEPIAARIRKSFFLRDELRVLHDDGWDDRSIDELIAHVLGAYDFIGDDDA